MVKALGEGKRGRQVTQRIRNDKQEATYLKNKVFSVAINMPDLVPNIDNTAVNKVDKIMAVYILVYSL